MEYNQKRFNDIRQIQSKFGIGLDSMYFVMYEDDKIFSNLLFTICNGNNDTAANGRKLSLGGELPYTPAHNQLNNKMIYVKLSRKDTLHIGT